MGKNPSKYLRPEAGGFYCSELDESQFKAFTKIVGLLGEAVDELPDFAHIEKQATKKGRILPWLNLYRKNQVVLLHGDRGVGKTTVLLSIVHACTQDKQSYENECEEKKARFSNFNSFKGILDKVSKIRDRLVWLEPLDMDPLPRPTNLLAAILARIEAAAQFYIPQGTRGDDRRGPRGILELCPGYLDAFQALQRLQSDVALAWDGNLPRRGEHIDPDTYAIEVMRAEKARLSLNHYLPETLDELAEEVFQGCGITDPLFVLPVDDVDLNPSRCLELLRLLRMIAVPRLFILALGSLDMVRVVLNLKYFGEFVSIGVGGDAVRRRDFSFLDSTYIASKAGVVASNAIRKLLPPAQRVRLGPMSVKETLNYQPHSPQSNLPRLHELLTQCPVSPEAEGKSAFEERGIKNLRSLLLYSPLNPISIHNERDITDEELANAIYTARAIFQMPPPACRRLVACSSRFEGTDCFIRFGQKQKMAQDY